MYTILDAVGDGGLVYIAGPMTGYPMANLAAFDAAEQALREHGVVNIFNPPRHDMSCGVDLSRYGPGMDVDESDIVPFMRMDLPRVLASRAVVFLDGACDSMGSNVEAVVAALTDVSMWRHDRVNSRILPLSGDAPARFRALFRDRMVGQHGFFDDCNWGGVA